MAALGLVGLFLASLAAATILPLQSEVIFAALQITGDYALWVLVAVASVGNTIGSAITCAMGRGLERFRTRRWFPFSQAQMSRAQSLYNKWGLWSLLLTWAPLGDVIALVAGVMRTPWPIFVSLVFIAKTTRYIVLGLAANGIMNAL